MKKKDHQIGFLGQSFKSVRLSAAIVLLIHTAPNLCLYNVFWCATLLSLSLSLFLSLSAMLRLVLHCVMAISLGKEQNNNNQKTNRTFADRATGVKTATVYKYVLWMWFIYNARILMDRTR